LSEQEPETDAPASRAAHDALSSWWRDAKVAAAFLTRLPVFGRPSAEEDELEETEEAEETALPEEGLSLACRAFPLVGLGIGIAGAIVLVAAKWLGLGPLLAGALAVATVIVVTGALHEDGLADAADGFGAGRDREARLAIMHDRRLGAFAVLAVVLSVLLRVGALAAIPDTSAAAFALIAAASFSRAILPAVMAGLDRARSHGLAVAAGKPPQDRVIASLLLGAVFVLLLLGPITGFAALLCGAGAAVGLAALAQRAVGGYTGDILGAIQQGTEIAVLLAAVAV